MRIHHLLTARIIVHQSGTPALYMPWVGNTSTVSVQEQEVEAIKEGSLSSSKQSLSFLFRQFLLQQVWHCDNFEKGVPIEWIPSSNKLTGVVMYGNQRCT